MQIYGDSFFGPAMKRREKNEMKYKDANQQ
jgi:hypothetical protein